MKGDNNSNGKNNNISSSNGNGNNNHINIDDNNLAMDVSLSQLAQKMADFASARDWDQYHTPRNLLLALVGEVGELSEIFQWRGEVPRGLPGWKPEEKEHLGEELSDVLLYLVRLADICNVNLGEAVLKKLEKNAKKYPAEQCKGSSSKYTAYSNGETSDAELHKT